MDAASLPLPARVEIAHVLFLDMVGYSRLPMEQQAHLCRELRAQVEGTNEFGRAQAQGELICLDTGDGMALLFFGDPIAPLRCAVQLGEVLPKDRQVQSTLHLRMGIHSGPVQRVKDINGRQNASGSGINMAQRIMDCGDAGHILLSRTSAEVLAQFEEWRSSLHDLGLRQVKHGEWVHLFSFHTPALGNSHRPARMPAARVVQAAQLTWAARHVWLTAALCCLLMFFLLLQLYHASVTITISVPLDKEQPVYAGPSRGGYR